MTTTTITARARRHDARVNVPDAATISDKALSELLAHYSAMLEQERTRRREVRNLQDKRPSARDEDARSLAGWIKGGSAGKQPAATATERLEREIENAARLLEAASIAGDDVGREIVAYLGSPEGAKVVGALESDAIAARLELAQRIDAAEEAADKAAFTQALYRWASGPAASPGAVSADSSAPRVLRAFASGPASVVRPDGTSTRASALFATLRPNVGPTDPPDDETEGSDAA